MPETTGTESAAAPATGAGVAWGEAAATAHQGGEEDHQRRWGRALEGGSPGGRGAVRGGSERPRPGHFRRLDRAGRARLLFRVEDYDRATHEAGRHGGAVGRAGQAVMRALVRFQDPATGRCDPSLEAIARSACLARSTVVEALARLRSAGFVTWTRRAVVAEGRGGGRRGRAYAQVTNAYRLALPEELPPVPRSVFRPPSPDRGAGAASAESRCESGEPWGIRLRVEKGEKQGLGREALAARSRPSPPSRRLGGESGALEAALARLGGALAARKGG